MGVSRQNRPRGRAEPKSKFLQLIMPNYDFKSLSPIDFEILVRDLIQEELEIRFESFKIGRDQGIDFRHWLSNDRSIVIQCKHFLESGYAKFIRELEQVEIHKVRKIRPNRYILAASIGLTPKQKEEIRELFTPFIKSSKDIYGNEDLNNLLGLYPKIEKCNFKLWFASIPILEEILHSRIKNISKDSLETIQDHARYYVQNESYNEALKILNKHNYCIIAGIPGIGKTILAEMLLLYLYSYGYEIIRISEDISEAYSLDLDNRKKIFYYDDFLGQTSLAEKLNRNEDQRILDFMHTIKRSKVSKLILTTREYILNQARIIYEKMGRAKFDDETCVIELSKYTRLIKGKILFNHIYFSNLPDQYKEYMLKNRNYLKIIDHPNYNPRIIDLMTEFSRIRQINPNKYLNFFLSNLQNPSEIWRHAFEEQISQASKDLLLVMGSMPEEMFLEDLREAFESFHQRQATYYKFGTSPQDYYRALKELHGNFIFSDKSKDRTIIRFHNPSIRDFVKSYIFSVDGLLYAILNSAIFFDQLIKLWRYGKEETDKSKMECIIRKKSNELIGMLRKTINCRDCQLINIIDGNMKYKGIWNRSFEFRAFQITSILEELKDEESMKLFDDILREIEKRVEKRDSNIEDLVRFLKNLKGTNLLSKVSDEFIKKARNILFKKPDWIDEIDTIREFVQEFPEYVSLNDKESIKSYLEDIALELPYDTNNPEQIRDDAEKLRSLANWIGVDLSNKIEELEDHATELESEAHPDDYGDEHRSSIGGDYCSDEEIESLFLSLR